MEPPVVAGFVEEFAVAEYLLKHSFTTADDGKEHPFITVGSLRQELEKISSPKVSGRLLDFIEFLLVVDHSKRPTAVEALEHPYLRESC